MNKELITALEAIKDECESHEYCDYCPLQHKICEKDPYRWDIEAFVEAWKGFIQGD